MVDVTEFIVEAGQAHTHIIKISDSTEYVRIQDPAILTKAIKEAEDYDIHELIGETCVPHIVFEGDPENGALYLSSIMKHVYNVHSPIAALHNPDSSNRHILCAPYIRVNKDQLNEISATFMSLCKHIKLPHTHESIKYLPLTWELTAYKDGSVQDRDVAFDDHPGIVLSTIVSSQPMASKIKMSASQAKKTALINSILVYNKGTIQGDRNKASQLVPMISANRSRDMSYFLTLGRCLYKIFGGDGDGLELWRSACVPEMQSVCDEYWPSLDTTCTYYSILTLQHWAARDNPSSYKEWNSLSVRAALEASVMATGGPLDVAEVAHRLDRTLFLCDGDEPKEAQFYMFNGTYYKACGTFAIQDYLEYRVIPEFDTYLKDLAKLIDANPDNNFKEMMQLKIDRCNKLIIRLKTPSYQKTIVEILMRKYNKPGFDNVRDSNPNLTVFEDCVFDGERRCIRDGIPEDYCTCSTGYEFKELWSAYNWSHPDIKCILENLEKIIVDPEKREFFRREIASRLCARNPYKRAIILYGPTNNGKTKFFNWMSKALGPMYCPDVPSNLFYSADSHPGNATPQYEMCRLARVVPQCEITDQHILNEGSFKKWTGGDKSTYRGLYQRKMKSFTPYSVIWTICNTIPRLNGNSAALRTRLLLAKLDSKFITEKDPEWEQIADLTDEARLKFMKDNNWYLADPHFDDVIEKTYKAFMWIMIQDYIKYSKNGIVASPSVPKAMREETASFFMKSNIYLQFIKSATRKDPSAPGVSLYALHNCYKKWFSDTVSKFGFDNQAKFEQELESMGIKHFNQMYNGIVITYQ